MKYLEIKNYLDKLIVFSTNDIKKLDDKFNKKKLFTWVKKWYIKQIRRWYYILSDIQLNDNFLYFIANKVYNPSYISLETALSFYNLIPETIYSITSISTKKTFNFSFEWINFSYKTINVKYFFWYKLVNFWKKSFLIWEMEKVLLDFLYLKKNIKDIEDIRWLRLNREILKTIDLQKLKKYTKIFNKKSLNQKVNILIDYIKKW